MSNELIIEGIIVENDNNRIGFYGNCETNKKVHKLAIAHPYGLELEVISKGNLVLSNNQNKENSLGMLVLPKVYDSLFSKLPIPYNKGDYDHIESPSMWFFQHDFPKEKFGYLLTKFSEIDCYRVEVSSRCDLVTNLDTANFFMPIKEKQVGQVSNLIHNGNVFAYISKK